MRTQKSKHAGVTVVITTYNAGKYLMDAVESVRSQTMENWKLLIIDDGSTDDNLAAVEHLDDPRIHIVRPFGTPVKLQR